MNEKYVKNEMVQIIVAPISGGHFPVQLKSYKIIMKYMRKPDCIFTGSGGSVASYCALASGWKSNMLDLVSDELHSGIFVTEDEEGFFNIIPPKTAVLFSGAIYKLGNGTPDFLSTFFTKETVQEIEIWSCAINRDSGKVGLFCNRKRNDSMVKAHVYDISLFNTEKLKYMCGNIEIISNAILASSSIPLFVEPVPIGKEYYIDCGAKFASALTPLQDEIVDMCKDKPIHVIYLSPYDTEESLCKGGRRKKSLNMMNTISQVTGYVVRGMLQQDKATCYHIIAAGRRTHYGTADIEYIEDLLSLRAETESSMIEIYPDGGQTLDIFHLKKNVLSSFIEKIRLKVRVWWVGGNDMFDSVPTFVKVER